MTIIDTSDGQLRFLGTFPSTEIERERLVFLGYPIYDEVGEETKCVPSNITQLIIFMRNATGSCNIDLVMLQIMLNNLGCGMIENPLPPDDSDGGFCVGA